MTDKAFCIVGIDPGLSGGFAFYFPVYPDRISAHDVPLVDKEIDAAHLAEIFRQMRPDVAMIEQVGAMPGQGVSSMFRFGQAVGVIQGVLGALQIPVHRVAPTVWKRNFKLDADKESARGLAVRLWPSAECFRRKRDHNRAEASLIARYYAEKIGGAHV